MMSNKNMLSLRDKEVIHKIYQANICSTDRMDINMCFFFIYYQTFMGVYRFRITKAFPLHWKKHLSKKLIDYLLTLEYYLWFSTDCDFDRVESRFLEEKVLEHLPFLFITYSPSPININIRGYNV